MTINAFYPSLELVYAMVGFLIAFAFGMITHYFVEYYKDSRNFRIKNYNYIWELPGIKYVPIKEMIDKGVIQEVNREFFNPIGLTLEVYYDGQDGYWLNGIQDHREFSMIDLKYSSRQPGSAIQSTEVQGE
jgi:hypothetical protein